MNLEKVNQENCSEAQNKCNNSVKASEEAGRIGSGPRGKPIYILASTSSLVNVVELSPKYADVRIDVRFALHINQPIQDHPGSRIQDRGLVRTYEINNEPKEDVYKRLRIFFLSCGQMRKFIS